MPTNFGNRGIGAASRRCSLFIHTPALLRQKIPHQTQSSQLAEYSLDQCNTVSNIYAVAIGTLILRKKEWEYSRICRTLNYVLKISV